MRLISDEDFLKVIRGEATVSRKRPIVMPHINFTPFEDEKKSSSIASSEEEMRKAWHIPGNQDTPD